MAPVATRQGVREDRSRAARAAHGRDDAARETRHRGSGRPRESERLGEEVGAFEGVVHNIADDVNSLVQAWSEANAEVVKGLVSVVGNLVVDLNESVGWRDRRDARGRRVDRTTSRRGAERDAADEDSEDVDDTADNVTRVSRSLSDAVKETANVIQRSGQRFQRHYERLERGDLDEGTDDDRHRGRKRARSGGEHDSSDEARERRYSEVVEEREHDVATEQPKPAGKS